MVISLAVDKCPFSVRPWAFLKVVRVMPKAFAVRFIRRAKAASEPSIASPSAVAASLADLIAAARIKWRNATRWPSRNPSFEGGSEAAAREMRTFLSSEISPASTASKTT